MGHLLDEWEAGAEVCDATPVSFLVTISAAVVLLS